MKNDIAIDAAAYIPTDRRRALAAGQLLPDRAVGTVLFADLSGFTPLTETCVRVHGAQRGAEEATRHLNQVYSALVGVLHAHGGSVVGFSGDGMMCWFAAAPVAPTPTDGSGQRQTTRVALACAQDLHARLAQLRTIHVGDDVLELGLKIAVSTGLARRMVVGNPDLHVLDVIAGAPVSTVGRLEAQAGRGETVLDPTTAALVADCVELAWPAADQDVDRAVIFRGFRNGEPAPLPAAPAGAPDPSLPGSEVRRWLQPAVFARLEAGSDSFLAELRPAVALFLRFSGLDFADAASVTRLDRFVRWVQEVLARFEGTLIQLTTGEKGNYLYAAFGAPIAHDTDAIRAAAAALALRRPPAELGWQPALQIGLAQGRMRVGPYGSDHRRTYGVQGPAVNLAARLMMHAQPGEIILDRAMAAAARTLLRIEARGSVPLKGKQEPEPIYAVADQAAIDVQTRLVAGDQPLFGRKAEMKVLEELLRATLAGTGALVRIVGDAGLGKSRMLAALAEHAAEQPLFLTIAACQITTRNTAFEAARQIGRQLFRLTRPELLDDAARIGQVQELLEQLNPGLLPRMPLLGDLLGLPIPDTAATAALEPKLRSEALVDLVQAIVAELTRVQPLVLLIEDVHWLDEASAELLVALGRGLDARRLLIVATQRPPTPSTQAVLARLDGLPRQRLLPLGELDAQGVADLVAARLGAPLAPLALDFVQAQAQGNPFFIEELLDALRETQDLLRDERHGWTLAPALVARLQAAHSLERRAGEWRLRPQFDLAASDSGLPDSIHGIILARLDRLPEAVQLTVKTASVIGRVFELNVLQAAHPQQPTRAQLAQHLATLEAREFARSESIVPEPTYLFKHNITQEVAYQTLLDRQRRQLHQVVGETLEQLQPAAVERLALHFYHSDVEAPPVRAKALRYLDAAAERAMRDYANETALLYVSRALRLAPAWSRYRAQAEVLHILGRRDEERAALERLTAVAGAHPIETRLLWGEYYDAISDYGAARQAIEQALEQSQAAHDRKAAARCYAQLGLIAWRLGDYTTASARYAAGLAALRAQGAVANEVEKEAADIHHGLGLVLRQQGSYAEAVAQFQEALVSYRRIDHRVGEAQALRALGLAEKHRRHFSTARACYSQALDLYSMMGARAGESECLLNMAEVFTLEGAHDQAEPLLRQSLEIQRNLDNEWWQLRILNGLGIVNMLTGQLAKARASLEEGLVLAERIGDASGRAYLLCNLGQVLGHIGRLAEAEQTLRSGHALAVAQEDKNLAALFLTELGIVSLNAGRAGDAIAHAARAVTCFEELDLEAAAATDLATLARAHIACGDGEQARHYIECMLAIPAGELETAADYPQRNYLMAYHVLHALRETEAAGEMLTRAVEVLDGRAAQLAASDTRTAFLALSFNQEILAAATQAGLTIGSTALDVR